MLKFGTSGWRGLIARDFTFENVRLATQGIALYLRSELGNPQSSIHGRKPVVILGYDTRFLGREFSLAAAEVLAYNQLLPLLCQRDTPTPAISFAIRHRQAIGGINMTASHNPAEYQGLKFSTSNGAPANPEVTQKLEANIAQLQAGQWSMKLAEVGAFTCKMFDPQPAYFKQLGKLVDFDTIRKVPTSHQIDAVARMFGVKVHETPVGFKYIGALMESEPIIVGGEESGGLSVKGHVPEKDGILACLLMAELVATEKKSLGQILKELEKQTGEFYTDRLNVQIPAEKKAAFLNKLAAGLESIGPFKVEGVVTTDGVQR